MNARPGRGRCSPHVRDLASEPALNTERCKHIENPNLTQPSQNEPGEAGHQIGPHLTRMTTCMGPSFTYKTNRRVGTWGPFPRPAGPQVRGYGRGALHGPSFRVQARRE